MSDFGVTAIRWNDEHTEVESCLVHEAESQGRTFLLAEGRPMWFADVASLVKGGDRVMVMEMNTDGEYEQVAEVEVRGAEEYLRTSPNSALFELPTF